MRKHKHLDPELLRSKLNYDPITGHISLKYDNQRSKAGHIYSTRYPGEYIHIPYQGGLAAAGRVAWVMMTGEQPDFIDHINGVKHDNSWKNLRSVTASENNRNRASHRKANGTFVHLEECC